MRGTLALLLLLLLPGCEERARPSVVPLAQTDLPSQESWKSTVTFSDSARVKAILWAGYIAMFAETQVTVLGDSIHVDFFDENERHSSVLTARRGRVNDRTRDFSAYENVVVRSDSGTTLYTDSLFWDNDARLIQTDAYVEIISPSEQIRGQGLVSDEHLRNYRISRVTGSAVTRE